MMQLESYSMLAVTFFIIFQFVCGSGLSTPTQNNYTVTDGNTTCIVMTTAMQLSIPYVGQSTKNLTASVNIPGNFSTSGTCSNDEDTLNIDFFDALWKLKVSFTNISQSSYEWSTITLSYRLDRAHFPNVSTSFENRTIESVTILPNDTLKTQILGSYLCEGETKLQLNNSITLILTNLQYRAFGEDNSTWFSNSNVQRCNSGTNNPETPVGVTVSIGIACAVLIVLVVILYLIADKILSRRKLSYD